MSFTPSTDLPVATDSPEDALRREALLRVKTAQEFLVLNTQLAAYRKKAQELSDELGARNTYIHRLHLEREEKIRQERQLWSDLEVFTHKLRALEDEHAALWRDMARTKASWAWSLTGWLRKLEQAIAPWRRQVPAPELPGYEFIYFLRTSPYRIYRQRSFTLHGWAFPRDGRRITAIRVRVGDTGAEFPARLGLEEPEAIAQHGAQASNPRPGFEVTFTVEPGRQQFRLEAQLENEAWYSVLSIPIWAELNEPRP